jgi:hypothetical protein
MGMPRYFTYDQASRLLPEVERLLRMLQDARAGHEEAETKLTELRRQLNQAGGMSLDPARLRRLAEARDQAVELASYALESITELGVQVKDLDAGLVDFPTLYRGEEVLLCWRIGEPEILHWHDAVGGFRGRRRVDGEFLQNHTGSGWQ